MICSYIYSHENCSQDDVSVALKTDKTTVGKALASLENKECVVRTQDEADKRIKRSGLTAAGREKVAELVELPEGDWCAFEIKLGANQIDAAAANLLTIKKQIQEDPKGKPPAVLCVICGMSNAAYRRPDSVFAVPITALKM